MGALGNVTGFWEGLTGPSRRLLIGAVVIFIVGIFVLMRFSGSDSYATLATSTSASDAVGDHQAARQPRHPLQAHRRRQHGAGAGGRAWTRRASTWPPRTCSTAAAVVGNEIFDKSNLGATDFTNRVNLVRAREGELSRTIGRLDPIQSATVKIAMPEEELFTERAAAHHGRGRPHHEARSGPRLRPGGGHHQARVDGRPRPRRQGHHDHRLPGQHPGGRRAAAPRAPAPPASAWRSRAPTSAASRAASTRCSPPRSGRARPSPRCAPSSTSTRSPPTARSSTPTRSSRSSRRPARRRSSRTGGAGGAVTGTSANTPAGSTFPATTSGSGTTDYSKNSEHHPQRRRPRPLADREDPGRGRHPVGRGAGQRRGARPPTSPALEDSIKAAVGYDAGARRHRPASSAVAFAEDGTAVTAAKAAAEAAENAAPPRAAASTSWTSPRRPAR